jgi:gliding motility-associated-like protein
VNVLCNGNNTGSINLTVAGGTAPYTYAWSNNATIQDPLTIVAGTYSVTVTDANGCTATASATITQPAAGLALSTTQVNVLCNGNNTGSINLTVTGGTAPYTYSWSNNAIIQDPLTLVAGTYTVTVTDANGCTATTSATITQPAAALALSTTQVNVLCNGNNTGSINLTVTGGTAPYTYAWSNNATIQDPLTLVAGTYSVTVTDANGCTATTSATITQPQVAIALSTTQVNVLCNGNNTGSINLTVTGGTAPYTYVWSNNATIQDPLTLVAGTYSVTVTDANGCTATASATITQPAVALALSTTQVNVLCNGNNTGSINLTVIGGTAPYTYAWSNNATIQDPLNLSSGTYSVTVTDANGCTATTSVTITQPAAALALSTTQVNVLCNGNNTGSINLTVTGGTAPYTYAWSNNATIQDPLTLAAGTYTVTVTDANGCTATTSATITQPQSALTVTTQTQNIICPNGTGSINSIPVGGVSPYTYSWTNQATTQNINGLLVGIYTVTVNDFNGCQANASGTIGLSLSPFPVQILNLTGTTVLTCSTPSITLQATGGVSYLWSAGSNNTNDTNSVNAPGNYIVNLIDPNGCPISQNITITQNITPPVITFINSPNTNSLDCNTSSINITASGGVSYEWMNTLGTTQSLSVSAPGNYGVFVTGANGCLDTGFVTITQAPAPQITTNDTTICSGQTAILIPTYSPAGGTYTWSTGPSSSSLAVTPMITTLYGLTYTWNGCSVQEDITVTVIQTPSINIANPTICMGDSTTITAIPDILGGEFLWNNGDTTNNLIVNPSINTQYNVQYVVNGCSTSATSAVTVNPIPTVSVNPTTVCQGLAATLTAASNLPGGSYVWSQGGTSSSITETPQTTTSYSVIYSLNGCSSAQASAIVTVNPLPQVILIADTTTGCVPATINFQANTTGQQAIYTWSSNGAASQSGQSVNMTFVSGGCYDVTLSATMNGCSNSTTSANYICVQDMPLASFGSSVDAITESPQTVSFFNESIGASSYIWNFGNGTLSNEFNPIQSFNSSSSEVNVILYAYTSMGCMDSVSKVFEINPGEIYYIPNTFTPDGDKHNQTFKPIFTSGIDFNNYSMLIYNRWGTVVFETHDVAVGWDGSFGNEGLDAQTGVYTYSIVIKMRETDERKIIAGHVNLLR